MSTAYLYCLIVVDDEVGITKSLYRQLHKKYLVFTANSVKDGLKIMIAGYTDIKAITGAINKEKLYRYISKPWDNQELGKLISDII